MPTLRLPQLNTNDLGRPKHRLRNPIMEGKLYAYRQPLYDFYGVTVNTALTRQLLYQVPQGGAYTPSGGAALVKTIWHTNMSAQGQLPSPEKFWCKGVSIQVRSDTALADAHRFLYDTVVTFNISNKPYLQVHAHRLPATGGLFGGSSGIVSNGWPEPGLFNTFGDQGETIEQLQTFSVEFQPTQVVDAGANATYTTATTANGGFGINAFCLLDGILFREVQ